MAQNVTREQALKEMHDMMEEARHYAGLHDINFISFFEIDEFEKSSVHSFCTQMYMAEMATLLYDGLAPEMREAFIKIQGLDKPRKTYLWGLIKIY